MITSRRKLLQTLIVAPIVAAIPKPKPIDAIDWLVLHSRDARWDVVGRMMRILEDEFRRKNCAILMKGVSHD